MICQSCGDNVPITRLSSAYPRLCLPCVHANDVVIEQMLAETRPPYVYDKYKMRAEDVREGRN